MIIRSGLLAALLLLATGPAMAQLPEPSPVSIHAHADPFRVVRRDTVPGPMGPTIEQERAPSGAQHVAVGALIGAALGFGAYLIHENTVPHTSHEMDPLVRISFMSIGTLAGIFAGAFEYHRRPH